MIAQRFFNAVYCISLARHEERWRSLSERLAQWGMQAARVEAVDGQDAAARPLPQREGGTLAKSRLSPGELGCLLSHRRVIQRARNERCERVLVLEDDVCLHRRFGERLAEIGVIGKECDLLYLGASQYERRTIRFINDHCYRARNTLGTFAYVMHGRLFGKFLAVTESLDVPVDVAMTRLQDDPANNCLVWHPPLAIADVRQSAIRGSRDLRKHAERMRWNLEEYDVPGWRRNHLERKKEEVLSVQTDFPACRFRAFGAEGTATCAHPRVRATKGIVTREICACCALREAPGIAPHGDWQAVQQSGAAANGSAKAAQTDPNSLTGGPERPSSRLSSHEARSQLWEPKERPTVILGIDRFGWAFHADAEGLVKHLRDEFAFTMVPHRELARRPEIVEGDLFVAFWWQSLLNIDTSRVGAVVCGLFDTWSWDIHGPQKLQAALDKTDVLLVSNAYILDDLRNHPAGFRLPATFICEEGVDCDVFRPQPFPGDFCLGWAGTTVNARGFRGVPDGKGLGIIQEAARLAGVRLVAAQREGGGGQIPHEAMPAQYYRRISAHCVGSYSEGAPLTVAEALACGRPVISTNVGTVPQLLQHGVNGLVVPREAAAIAAAMKELRNIGPDRMATAARRSALLFDWSRQAPKWAHCFRSALELSHRRTHARIAQRPEYAAGEWQIRRYGR